MRILREWLGGNEEIDLDSNEGARYFAEDIIQDGDAATFYIDILSWDGQVVVNESEPTFIERYTVLDKTPQN